MADTQLSLILLSSWLIGVTWTVGGARQCAQKQKVFWEVVEGYALDGHVITTLIAPSVFICGHKCVLAAGCASYNYGTESTPSSIRHVCQLNSQTHKTRLPSLRIKPGYLYVASKVCLNGKDCKKECSALCPCECKPGFTGNDCQTWTGADGSSSVSPGKSCQQIRAHGHSRGDMKYWIDPLGEGNPFQVYCDMTVDGGGWTVIKEVTLTTSSPLTSNLVLYNYRNISEQLENQLISVSALLQLQKDMGFSQLRFYCYKKSVNRTFHIMTKNNSLGAAVVKYYTADPTTQPQACDSFTRLLDDSSIVAQNCLKWGYKDGKTELNKWGHSEYHGPWRIYHRTALWENHYYVGFFPLHGYWCDDNQTAALSVGDKFGLYVR